MATTVQPKRKGRKKSVLKRIRQTRQATAVNRIRKAHLRNQLKKFRKALETDNLTEARTLLYATLAILDQAAQKGVLHPNNAARTKSRLVLRYNALQKKTTAA